METCMNKAFLGARPFTTTARGTSQVTRAAVEFYGPNRSVRLHKFVLASCVSSAHFIKRFNIEIALHAGLFGSGLCLRVQSHPTWMANIPEVSMEKVFLEMFNAWISRQGLPSSWRQVVVNRPHWMAFMSVNIERWKQRSWPEAEIECTHESTICIYRLWMGYSWSFCWPRDLLPLSWIGDYSCTLGELASSFEDY